MFDIFKRRRKKRILTSHEKAITIMHLHTKIQELQKEVDAAAPDDDKWCTKHDISCLENAISYLDGK